MDCFTFKGIEFVDDSNYLSRGEVQGVFNLLDAPAELPIFEVDLEEDSLDEFTMYIYIENGDVTEIRQDTFEFLQQLKARGFDAMISDEDYGGSDVIILTFDIELIAMERRLFNLKAQRHIYMCTPCTPRPKRSPYCDEIEALEQKLGLVQ